MKNKMKKKMYTMKEVSEQSGLSYETLKFYCNEGLIPHVKRNAQNHRIFSEHCLQWIISLSCLRNCNMSIEEMKTYLRLCLEGPSSIPTRQIILDRKLNLLKEEMKVLQESIDYIEKKQDWYDGVQNGTIEYYSNLINEE